MVPPMQPSAQERIARHKDFLRANAEIIGAFAWENCLKEGRGAVLVPEEDFIHAPTPQLKRLRFHYLPLAKHDQEPFKSVLSEKELGWLAGYDPDEKVVVCILREPSGVSSYFIGGRSRPSEAYARQKAKSN